MYVSDISGRLLKTIPATDSGSVWLNDSDLKAGIYTYSLVVDGNIVDTKKTILAK
ncbi:MAG: T9SS type A sorting domain-containing protein [Tannerella sp.]|nr:T9SS type A sorting domain-containing protein [Tannerella sp.]